MASGFFCVTRPGHFELGLEACAHQRVERCVLDLHAMRPAHLLAQGFIRGKAFWAAEHLLETGEHCGREGDRFASGDIGGQESVQASRSIERQPAPDGIPMDSQKMRHVLAGMGLPTGQEVEHLQARLLVAVMFMWQALLESRDLFVDWR
jgi:hypothetical protein